jgi:hypothetical protein
VTRKSNDVPDHLVAVGLRCIRKPVIDGLDTHVCVGDKIYVLFFLFGASEMRHVPGSTG